MANRSSSLLFPTFRVAINGAPLPVDAILHITDISVEDDLNLPAMFTLTLEDSDNRQNPTPWIDDEKLFAIGNSVEIRMGFAATADLPVLFSGEITALEPEFTQDRLPGLRLRGYDRRHRLQRGRKTHTFLKSKDSDIATQIAQQAGLKAEVQDSKVIHEYVLQAQQTDLDFLRERAARIHFEMKIEGETLLFQPAANADGEALTLTMGAEILEFSPRLSSSAQVSEVVVQGWSARDKKPITGRAEASDQTSKMGGQQTGAALAESAFHISARQVSGHALETQEEADQLARARFNALALNLVQGDGLCSGNALLRPGKVIKIEGVGKRFSGLYYLSAVRHRYTLQDGYTTRFSVRRNAT